MHELAIAKNVVEICETHAGENKVARIDLDIGNLSGVLAESLEFCFEACTKGTLLEGAHLHINKIKGTAKCPACSASFEILAIYDSCPRCQSFPVEIISGREMRVCEIEIEEKINYV